MALSGLHVSFHDGYQTNPDPKGSALQVYGPLMASETSASAGALSYIASGGRTVARIIASAESYVSIAAVPNASTGKRVLAQAGVPVDVFMRDGEGLAWTAA